MKEFFDKIVKTLFYYYDEEACYKRQCFKWYKGCCHAGIKLSLGNYFNNHVRIKINLFFGELYIYTHIKINKSIDKIGATNYKEYGFEFTNFEGCEHLLSISWGKKRKLFDMPWHLEHYRTTYYDINNKPFFHEYSYPSLIRKLFPNDKLHIWEIRREYINNNEKMFKKEFNYTYKLKSGEVQKRKAKVSVNEMEWRRNWWQWCKIGNEINRYIEIEFNEGTGEKVGTWKGGVYAMNFKMNEGETIKDAFKRFEKTAKL